jgi:hypothetical protein
MCCVVFRHCHQLANGAFHQHQSSVTIVHAMSIRELTRAEQSETRSEYKPNLASEARDTWLAPELTTLSEEQRLKPLQTLWHRTFRKWTKTSNRKENDTDLKINFIRHSWEELNKIKRGDATDEVSANLSIASLTRINNRYQCHNS